MLARLALRSLINRVGYAFAGSNDGEHLCFVRCGAYSPPDQGKFLQHCIRC